MCLVVISLGKLNGNFKGKIFNGYWGVEYGSICEGSLPVIIRTWLRNLYSNKILGF